MKAVMKIICKINRSMFWVVGGIILIMGLALFYSVIMRYFFRVPQPWAFDLVGWFTGMSAVLSGGYAILLRAHVRVDIFFEKFSDKTQSAVDIISAFFLFIMALILMVKGWEQVVYYYNAGIMIRTGLPMPVWIKWAMIPIGGFLLAIQGLVNLINDFHVLFTGKKYYEEEEG